MLLLLQPGHVACRISVTIFIHLSDRAVYRQVVTMLLPCRACENTVHMLLVVLNHDAGHWSTRALWCMLSIIAALFDVGNHQRACFWTRSVKPSSGSQKCAELPTHILERHPRRQLKTLETNSASAPGFFNSNIYCRVRSVAMRTQYSVPSRMCRSFHIQYVYVVL